MTEVSKCGGDGCNPVLQVRGQMGPGDYHGQFNRDGSPDLDFHKKVELFDPVMKDGQQIAPGNKEDIRVLCKKCGLASPWSVGGIIAPGISPAAAANAAKETAVEAWNAAAEAKHTRDEMVTTLTKQFGADAVQKHFGPAL